MHMSIVIRICLSSMYVFVSCMCVCTYVCMYVCMYNVCMYLCRVCMYVCMYVCIYVSMSCMYVCICVLCILSRSLLLRRRTHFYLSINLSIYLLYLSFSTNPMPNRSPSPLSHASISVLPSRLFVECKDS